MRGWHRYTLLLGVAVLMSAPTAQAAMPGGSLDAANWNLIGGWARDPDNPTPVAVHIYIDGNLAHAMLADGVRPDLPYADQNHGFTWVPPLLGPGNHQVVVHAIGVDGSGVPNGENPALSGTPKTISAGCTGFTLSALAWCQGVTNYYVGRSNDAKYLYSDQLRVGMNASFGGTILELYGPDHSFNRLVEHGGGAVQLSIWGYDPQGPDAFFAADGCDPTSYATEADCHAAGHAECRLWCCSEGDHIADCTSVNACAFGAGGPFNPIQAQAANCGWDSPTNDVDEVTTLPSGAIHMRKDAPYHFTKSTSFPGMTFEQTTSIENASVRLDYRITYNGVYSLTPHPQEIPAVFPAAGLNHTYFYFVDDAAYVDANAPVKQVSAGASGLMLRLKNRDPYPHSNVDDVITENWISACDSGASKCVTLAVFSEHYKEINAAGYPGNGEGYLTPLGGFAVTPGLDVSFTAWLFPYRYDEVVLGKTVRAWIHEIAAGQGCLAYGVACDDGDPCTTQDRCDGNGTCRGQPAAGCQDGGSGGSGPDASAGGTGGSDAALDASGGSGWDAMTGGSGGTSGTDAAGDVAAGGSGTSPSGAYPPPESSDGCTCRAGRSASGWQGWLVVCAGLLVARRRRRKTSTRSSGHLPQSCVATHSAFNLPSGSGTDQLALVAMRGPGAVGTGLPINCGARYGRGYR